MMNPPKKSVPDVPAVAPRTTVVPYQIGDRIGGNHEIWQILGGQEGHGGVRSGMGLVYVAYSHEHKNVYALKTFQDQFLRNDAARKRFENEAHLWIELERHPYLVRAHFVEKVKR